ncbi:MAG: hypothetical protein IPN42_12530 [Methylococcaceae bacterium]|nr:hypothetical protein [Methylococcaceae bacterium]
MHTDSEEKRVRFGCGFIFGFFIGGIVAFKHMVSDGNYLLTASVILGLVCGIAAMKQGDKFWEAFLTGKWWW